MECNAPYYVINLDYENFDYWAKNQILVGILKEASEKHHIFNFRVKGFLEGVIEIKEAKNRKRLMVMAEMCRKKKEHIYARKNEIPFQKSCSSENKPRFCKNEEIYEIYSDHNPGSDELIQLMNFGNDCVYEIICC